MKLKIDYKKITDAPYKEGNDSFFSFTSTEVKSFVDIISKMNESSYYISGFRGVGKTSFIKKTEEELIKLNNFIFIHVPVAKYDKYEILIRSFIRQFYIQFVDKKIQERDEIKKNLKTVSLVDSLSRLNQETFSSLNTEKSSTRQLNKIKEFIIVNYKEEILLFITILITIIVITTNFKSPDIYKLIAQLISTGVAVVQAIKLGYTIKKTITISNQHKETEKSLYDDEIAEHRFTSLLKDFKLAGIKPVFILDELDKLPIKDAKKVLYLFKSTLLSGDANFIAVGGQDLYYELHSANDSEDNILSTLFSRTFHVKLKSSYELRDLFDKLVLNKEIIETDEKRIAFNMYVNGFILESKRIPRKFINLIKGDLYFEGDDAFLNVSEEYNRPSNTELLSALDIVCENIINYPEPIKDYIIMNLFSEKDNLIGIKTKEELNDYIINLK